MPRPKPGYVTKTIRFLVELNTKMEMLSELTRRSQTELFNEAVQEYLERREGMLNVDHNDV